MIIIDRSKQKQKFFQSKFKKFVFTFDDSFVVVVVDEIHYEMYIIAVEIAYDMDI
jgi:hypothetical protein